MSKQTQDPSVQSPDPSVQSHASSDPDAPFAEAGHESADSEAPVRAAKKLLPDSLKAFQRTHLRRLAHDRKPLVQVGQRGVTHEVLEAVDRALLDHELIKVRLSRPEDKKSWAAQLAEGAGAHLCGLIGHTVILYRRHPHKPSIVLPSRREQVR